MLALESRSLTRYIYNKVGNFLLVALDIWHFQDPQIFPHWAYYTLYSTLYSIHIVTVHHTYSSVALRYIVT